MFLSGPRSFGRGPSGQTPSPGANCPHGPGRVFLREHGISFHLFGATPEMLPSLKRRLFGGRRWHRRVTGPFRSAYGSGLPSRGWDGVGLSPVSVVSHCVQARPPVTVSVRSAAPSPVLRGEEARASSARLRQARGRGLPTRPKRDPSRTTLAWPLRQRPLPCAAGCVASLAGDWSKSFRTGTAPHG